VAAQRSELDAERALAIIGEAIHVGFRATSLSSALIAVIRVPRYKITLSSARNWFMSESPVEHFEHAEHAALLADPFLRQVAVTIAILAVIAATVGSLETLETAATIDGKNVAVLLPNNAIDTWNFYQAKSIKKNLYAIAAANGGPKADDFKMPSALAGNSASVHFSS
jgi:uncharacterized protein DUF4337